MLKAGMKFVFYTGLIAIACFVLTKAQAKEEKPEIKAGKITKEEFSQSDFRTDSPTPLAITSSGDVEIPKFSGGGYEPDNMYVSDVQMVDQVFNAIGAYWEYDAPSGTGIKVEIRVFDGEVWSDWQTMETGDMVGRDDKVGSIADDISGKAYSDLVFVETGKGFQYRVLLSTENQNVTPKLEKIEFTYIDSSKGPKASEFENGWFKKVFAADTQIDGAPNIISRTEWGCPEGETSPRWAPETASKSFQVYHHTVTTNGAEPYSTMRAIWYYQANTREWGDIGYNYLVDQYGHVFKGRNGPEDVIGAHVYGYNTHSIGVAVLGTYTSVSPSSSALSGLSSILAYSAFLTESPIKLYGHRELTPTQCPGDAFFAKKSSIVSAAKTKLATYPDLRLFENNGDYYYYNVTSDKIRKFANTQMVRDWGFDPDKAITKTDEEIAGYEVLPEIKSFARYYGNYYLVTAGQRHYFDSDFVRSHWGVDESNSFDVTDDKDLLTARTVRGINVFRFISKPGEALIYVVESEKKRPIPTRIFNYRHFSSSLVVPVSQNIKDHFADGRIYPYPTGTLVRAVDSSGIYYSYGDYKRPVSLAAFRYIGYSSRPVINETSTYVDMLLLGNNLLQEKDSIIEISVDGHTYRYWVRANFKRRYIPHTTVFDAWSLSEDDVIQEDYNIYRLYSFSSTLMYPSGILVQGDERTTIYFVDLEKRYSISLTTCGDWGLDDDLIVSAPQEIVDAMRFGGKALFDDGTIMYMQVENGGYRFYYISAGQKRYMPSTDIYRSYNFSDHPKIFVSNVMVESYPSGENLYYPSGILIRGIGLSGVYYMEANQKRYVSAAVFDSWHFDSADIRDISVTVLNMIPDGADLGAKKLTTLVGPYGSPVRLPAYSGKTAREQHLWLIANETEAHHYAVSGTPLDSQNGMAGGYGAFGSAASVSQERYYVNMRWLYCTWYEDGDGVTRTKDCDATLKDWHRHKKLIVSNPATGKSVVVSIEESGPAIWTGRVSGLSPEAMKVIGALTNDNLTYYWAGSQTLPLGAIN